MDHPPAGNKPPDDTDEPQEELEPKSADDNQAEANVGEKLEKQNETARNLLAAGAIALGLSTAEINSAYSTLNKPIDAKKLLEDPTYRNKIIKSQEFVFRKEQNRLKNGTSKYKDKLDLTRQALAGVSDAYAKIGTTCKQLTDKHLETVYSLTSRETYETQIRARELYKENPNLPISEAIRIESEQTIQQRISGEVNNDKNVGRFSKEKEIEARLKIYGLEERGKQFLDFSKTQGLDEQIKQKRSLVFEESAKTITERLGPQIQKPTKIPTFVSKIFKPTRFNLPKLKTPSFFKPLSAIQAKFTNFLNLQKQMMEQIKNQVQKVVKEAVEKMMRSVIRRATAALAKQALNQGLKLALKGVGAFLGSVIPIPIVGTIAGWVASGVLANALTKAYEVSKYGIMVVIAVAIGLPLLLSTSSQLFSTNADSAIPANQIGNINMNQNKKLTWKQFEKNVLGIQTQDLGDWTVFENKFLNNGEDPFPIKSGLGMTPLR